MFCKKCGTELTGESKICVQCGFDNSAVTYSVNYSDQTKTESGSENMQTSENKKSGKKMSNWCWGAIVSLCCAVYTLFKGINKMVSYSTGDYYPYKVKNAYVGGDAYNYIINANYATAFFALTTMFVLAAIGMMLLHYLSKMTKEM